MKRKFNRNSMESKNGRNSMKRNFDTNSVKVSDETWSEITDGLMNEQTMVTLKT